MSPAGKFRQLLNSISLPKKQKKTATETPKQIHRNKLEDKSPTLLAYFKINLVIRQNSKKKKNKIKTTTTKCRLEIITIMKSAVAVWP